MESSELLKKGNLICFILSIIATILINIFPPKHFFGACYANLYIILPLLCIQGVAVFFRYKYKVFALLLNFVVLLIFIYLTIIMFTL